MGLFDVLAMQVALQDSGLKVDASIIVGFAAAVVTTLSSTVAFLYREQQKALRDRIVWLEAEIEKRDRREERLVEQLDRTADGLHRTVSLAEQRGERGGRR